jgi:tetratricopeptide (TPR) repeat protein
VALTNLERLAAEIDGWSDLAALYEQELEKLLDPLRQTEMGLRLARVYEEELGAIDQAIAHYDQVLTADPENSAATLALDRLYLTSGQYEKLAEVLKREIELAETDSQIIELQFRLGQLYQEQLEDKRSAIDCYRDILATTPEHSGAVTSLELLLDESDQQLEIAEVLEPLYRMSEQWSKLVRIMEVQLEHTEDQLDKVGAVQRIAEICEQRLDDPIKAFEWYGRALEFDPTSEMIAEELERLAAAVDGWGELTSYYERVLQSVDEEERKRLLLKIARVCDQELRDPARAEEAYLRVLELDAEEPDALSALDRIYEAASMHRELAQILTRRVGITDDSQTLVELQLRLAMTYEVALEELDSAVEVYTSVLEQESRNARALEALERIYFRREQWGTTLRRLREDGRYRSRRRRRSGLLCPNGQDRERCTRRSRTRARSLDACARPSR